MLGISVEGLRWLLGPIGGIIKIEWQGNIVVCSIRGEHLVYSLQIRDTLAQIIWTALLVLTNWFPRHPIRLIGKSQILLRLMTALLPLSISLMLSMRHASRSMRPSSILPCSWLKMTQIRMRCRVTKLNLSRSILLMEQPWVINGLGWLLLYPVLRFFGQCLSHIHFELGLCNLFSNIFNY